MGRCAQLKWNRRNLGMKQEEYAKHVDLSVTTIRRLETDETAWLTLRPETEEKIIRTFTNPSSWNLSSKDISRGLREIGKEMEKDITEDTQIEAIGEPKPEVIVEKPVKVHSNKLTENDNKTYTLLEFAYGGLKDAKQHEEFAAYMNICKRILSKY